MFILAYISFGAGVILLVVSVVLFFKLNVKEALDFVKHKRKHIKTGKPITRNKPRKRKSNSKVNLKSDTALDSAKDVTNIEYSSGSEVNKEDSSPKGVIKVSRSEVVSSVAEESEKDTDLLAENSENPTDILCEDSETPTGLLEQDSETPTGILVEDTEKPTGILSDDLEKPTGVLVDKDEKPTCVLDSDIKVNQTEKQKEGAAEFSDKKPSAKLIRISKAELQAENDSSDTFKFVLIKNEVVIHTKEVIDLSAEKSII